MAPISRTLEVTVISAEDLHRHRKRIKNSSFASVKIDSQKLCSAKIDDRGGSDPFWNDKMALKLPSNISFVTIHVHSGNFSRNKILGTVNIPVSDFLGGLAPESYLHFLSYRLRDDRGSGGESSFWRRRSHRNPYLEWWSYLMASAGHNQYERYTLLTQLNF